MSDEKAPRNGKRSILIGVGTLVGLALLLTFYWAIWMRGIVSSDDARFSADLVDIAPQVGGTLASLAVSEGDSVAEGQLLFTIDHSSLEAAAARADAAVASAKAALAMAQANHEKSVRGARKNEIEMAQATEERTRAQEELAKADWERVKGLFEKNVVPPSERDRAKTAWETAKHAHEEAAAHLALLKQGARREDRVAAQQNVELARAQLASAEAAAREAHIRLDDATVEAPFTGIVVRTWLEPGSAVSPGKPVVTVMNPSTMHISANVEEKSLADIRIGDPVDISVDAYPRLDLKGRVTTIVRATKSEFSLIPSEGVSGTFIKVTQRVPLRIDLDRNVALPVSPGLSVEIRINTRNNGSRKALAQQHD